MQLNIFDNISLKNVLLPYKDCNLLELFAGSRCIGNLADQLGIKVFSVDWQKFDKINLSIDIGELNINDIPFIPNVIWASPDCATYSVAGIKFHRNGIIPTSEYAKKCDLVNLHLINLINEWLKINPQIIYFIENPRGMLRKMPFMAGLKRHTVWYCKYGDKRAKPTDIWTNSNNWLPRSICYNNNKKCHHEPSPRGCYSGTAKLSNSYERSKIPVELCKDILNSCCK
jgi:hypothetical protein